MRAAATSRSSPAARATRTARRPGLRREQVRRVHATTPSAPRARSAARTRASPKAECTQDDQCPAGQVCQAGKCKPCAADSECGPGGRARPARASGRRSARKDDECADDEDCVNGFCKQGRRGQRRRRDVHAADRLLRRSTTRASSRASATASTRNNAVHREEQGQERAPRRPHRYVGHRGVQHRAVRAPRAVGRRLPRRGSASIRRACRSCPRARPSRPAWATTRIAAWSSNGTERLA